MAYDNEPTRQQRVEIETPGSNRRVIATDTTIVPRERGMSPGTVAALVLGAVALVAIIFFFVMGQNDTERDKELAAAQNAKMAAEQQAANAQQRPVIVQQPAAPAPQQAPVIIQQPASQPQQAPVVIQQTVPPADGTRTTTTTTSTKPGVPDDAMIQSDIDRKMAEDEKLSALGVSFTVLNGKVTLLGTVASNDLKRMAESAVKKVKGVRSVDNKIIVTQ